MAGTEKDFTAAISQELIGEKVKVTTSLALGDQIKGILSEIGTDYIIVGEDIINIRHVVKIRKA